MKIIAQTRKIKQISLRLDFESSQFNMAGTQLKLVSMELKLAGTQQKVHQQKSNSLSLHPLSQGI
jgi:hypothetical protein